MKLIQDTFMPSSHNFHREVPSRCIGIDGCRGGWIAVTIDKKTKGIEAEVYPCIKDFWQANEKQSALIDIPIGLPNDTSSRECDRRSRLLLGKGLSSRVFNPPIRPALNSLDYNSVNIVNSAATGKKISKQTYNIIPKIREVDQLLQEQPEAKHWIRESHPEVCFSALNNGAALRNSKHTYRGMKERIDLISLYLPTGESILHDLLSRFTAKTVGEDDIVDAMALAVLLRFAKRLFPIPENPPSDQCDLPMQIISGEF